MDSSWASILRVTMPMILSTMSTNLMYIIDRFMLAGYSISAMNASVASGTFVSIFTFMFIGIVNSAETLVGQYNGAKKYTKLAAPIWQMIYLSLLSCVFFLPIAYFSDVIHLLPPYFLEEGVAYQEMLMYFGALPPLKMALAAFFIGQGKSKIIVVSVLVGVLANVVLDYAFIYGVAPIIPRLGCRGAAIASIIAELIQIMMLAIPFFNAKNRRHYKTWTNRAWNWTLFKACCRVGVPISLVNAVSLIAWYIVQSLVGYVSQEAATVYSIGINVYIFFIFVGEGVNKAVIAICSNMIGRNDLDSIEKTRKNFAWICIFFGTLITVPLIFCPNWIMAALDSLPDNIASLYKEIKDVLCIVALGVTIETLMMATWGILLAGGDTRYAAIIHQICMWIVVVLPTVVLYFSHFLTFASVPYIFGLITAWAAITQLLIYKRYKSMQWCKKLLP
ncbi:MAG: MATE family efflux transporter [Holosporales bacterium]|nr:MATE family efflux transporter [Holosporales bacterium]